MLYIFKDSDGNQLGFFNLGRNDPRSYVGETHGGGVVATYELADVDNNLTDRELTEKKDGELRQLIADLTARVTALENA